VRKWVGGCLGSRWGGVPAYVKHAGQQAKLLGQSASQSHRSALGVQSLFEILGLRIAKMRRRRKVLIKAIFSKDSSP